MMAIFLGIFLLMFTLTWMYIIQSIVKLAADCLKFATVEWLSFDTVFRSCFQPLKHMIGFNYLFVQPLLDSGISFRSDEYLSQCRVPVLILHADNDWIVPAALGRRVNEYYTLIDADYNESQRTDSFSYYRRNSSSEHLVVSEWTEKLVTSEITFYLFI